MRFVSIIFLSLLWPLVASANEICAERLFNESRLTVCAVTKAHGELRVFHADDGGNPFREFAAVNKALEAGGEKLSFAMNAGMYARDRSPIGLYVEDGVTIKNANTRPGPGNFHLLPNGVFYVDKSGAPGVMETKAFLASKKKPEFASQSGPMLVIDGALHPKFLEDSTSRKIRNGVGIGRDGKAVFVKSETPVTFHQFASFFKEEIGAQNALYLDGTISRLYAPELNRNDFGVAMGPIVGLVIKK